MRRTTQGALIKKNIKNKNIKKNGKKNTPNGIN
jgi:hypothetical protein